MARFINTAVEPLISVLYSGSLRLKAISSLGKLGDERAVYPLKSFAKDPLTIDEKYHYVDDTQWKEKLKQKICEEVERAIESIKKQNA